MISIFNSKCVKSKHYPVVGKTTVYIKHDEHFGKCLIHESNFVTPNMPKLHYALSFRVVGETINITGLSQELSKYDKAWVFEKRDGFNCLFYEYKGKIIPKTRQSPIATGKIMDIINLREFPYDKIKHMVRDGYVPIFEVWGTVLDKFQILHSCINLAEVQKVENLPELNVDLIAVMEADYETYEYRFLPPKKIIDLSQEYGLTHVKFHGVTDVSLDKLLELMEEAEKKNEKTYLTEGYVLHCYPEYAMFKLKPMAIMVKDIVLSKTVPRDRIVLEISKVALENSILEIMCNPDEYIQEVIEYLKEDYSLTKKHLKKIREVFIDFFAQEYVKHFEEEPWKLGVHSMFIRRIKVKKLK